MLGCFLAPIVMTKTIVEMRVAMAELHLLHEPFSENNISYSVQSQHRIDKHQCLEDKVCFHEELSICCKWTEVGNGVGLVVVHDVIVCYGSNDQCMHMFI